MNSPDRLKVQDIIYGNSSVNMMPEACEAQAKRILNALDDSGFLSFNRRTAMSDLKKIDVKGVEVWREYDFEGRVYRIDNPVSVEFRVGSTTHRVTDSAGVVHCVPAPGEKGCVLRWSGAVIA